MIVFIFFFFFQAEDGIRDYKVTGVQTCALPILIEEYRFSGDGSKLLLFTHSARVWRQNTKGTFYVWDLAGKRLGPVSARPGYQQFAKFSPDGRDRKSTRLNSSHLVISYAVFCLKKKKNR